MTCNDHFQPAQTFPDGRRISVGEIELMVYEAGSGPAIMLLHGFPELAYSWRHQVPDLVAAGHRVIVPDLRGYGGSDAPSDPGAYSMRTVVADLVGLLDALEVERTVLVGHDAGGMVAWHMGVYAPDRVAAIASLCTPHGPRGRTDIAESYRRHRGPHHYMTTFQVQGIAEAVFEADVDATFRAMLRGAGVKLERFRQMPVEVQQVPIGIFVGDPPLFGAPIVSETELAVYVETYRRTGFAGGLNWYRSTRRTWEEAEGVDMTIDKPALLVQAADDLFLPPDARDVTEIYVPRLERRLVSDCGHWIQQERPAEVNWLLRTWLVSAPVTEALTVER
jgi:pimeloyl-ACP methyl ester carboxylesterase